MRAVWGRGSAPPAIRGRSPRLAARPPPSRTPRARAVEAAASPFGAGEPCSRTLRSPTPGSARGRRRHRGPRRVDVVPDAARELAGVASPDGLKLAGEAVARPDLDLTIPDPALETVKRAWGRATDPLAEE